MGQVSTRATIVPRSWAEFLIETVSCKLLQQRYGEQDQQGQRGLYSASRLMIPVYMKCIHLRFYSFLWICVCTRRHVQERRSSGSYIYVTSRTRAATCFSLLPPNRSMSSSTYPQKQLCIAPTTTPPTSQFGAHLEPPTQSTTVPYLLLEVMLIVLLSNHH